MAAYLYMFRPDDQPAVRMLNLQHYVSGWSVDVLLPNLAVLLVKARSRSWGTLYGILVSVRVHPS